MRPLRDSTDLFDNGPALRQRVAEDGYLFFRGVLPREPVMAVREQLLEILAEAGWLDEHAPRSQATAHPTRFAAEPDPEFLDVFYRQLSLKSINALPHHPVLVGLLERILGDEVFVQPRIITRNMFPRKEAYTTPAHQDHPLVQGPTEHYAAWIPLGSCPAEMGGYCLAPGTHRNGYYEFEPALGIGQMEITDLPDTWVHGATEPGDVIVHHAMLVHRGVPNRSDSIRLSVDCRYQRLREPVVDRALIPSLQQASWEQLYRGWDDDEYKYYWKDLGLEVVPFDLTPFDKRDEMAIAMGFKGDARARSALVGVIHRHRDPAMRSRATEALAELDRQSQA